MKISTIEFKKCIKALNMRNIAQVLNKSTGVE